METFPNFFFPAGGSFRYLVYCSTIAKENYYDPHLRGRAHARAHERGRLEHLGGVVEALRVGQDNPIPFNISTPGLRVDYFREPVHPDRPMVFS